MSIGRRAKQPLKRRPRNNRDRPPASRHVSRRQSIAIDCYRNGATGSRTSQEGVRLPRHAFAFFASTPLRSLRFHLALPLRVPCACGGRKIFSNHWETAEKFFQSLEKSGRFFQPLENFFPIIGKSAFGRGATGLCAPGRAPAACRKFRGVKRAGRARAGGQVLAPGVKTMGGGRWGRIQGMGYAQAFAPLREGGAARWKDWQWDCAFGANGKGGGGSTAGSRRCMRPVCRAAEVLIRSLPVRSRACRDGQAQYSPRRGPCRFPPSRHGHPIHGRATPLSEGGGSWHLP